MYVAGYGPKALAVAGRVGDGVIIQLADPEIIGWIMDTARKAAEEEGRDPAALKCHVCAPSHVSDDIADARNQVRWFPAMVSNHVMDLIERYGFESEIPAALTEYVKARKFYDYKDHSRVGAAHGEFVTDEICDRFCVLGTPEQITQKLQDLEGIGVDHFNIYLMTHGPGGDARRLPRPHPPAVRAGRRLAERHGPAELAAAPRDEREDGERHEHDAAGERRHVRQVVGEAEGVPGERVRHAGPEREREHVAGRAPGDHAARKGEERRARGDERRGPGERRREHQRVPRGAVVQRHRRRIAHRERFVRQVDRGDEGGRAEQGERARSHD